MARLDLDVPDNGNETRQTDFEGSHLRNKMRHAPVDVLSEHQMDTDWHKGSIERDDRVDGPSERKEPSEENMLDIAESFIRNSNEEFLIFSERIEGNQNAIDRMINTVDNEIETLAIRMNELNTRRDVLYQRLQEFQHVRESGQKVRDTLNNALYSNKEKAGPAHPVHPNDANLARAMSPSFGRN